MRVIAPIEDADVIRRILEHRGCWAPREARPFQRAPPTPIDGAGTELTHHPVPDIG